MKVSQLLESRQANWQELEGLSVQLEGRRRRKLDPAAMTRFAALYRAACADLALADAHQLPPQTIDYLHRLVGRAHNQLYRSRRFQMATWTRQILVDVPRRLLADRCLWLAMAIFWGTFLVSAMLASSMPGFAEQVAGKEFLEMLEDNFSNPIDGIDQAAFGGMAGFYILHNIGIGFRCFAFGLFFGIGGLFETFVNAAVLGTAFGHMATVSQRDNFFHFVTAHGPFELTAIVLSAAAGMRLGFSLVDTKGLARAASLRRASEVAMPTIMAAATMFFLAAMLEAFLSPSSAPYPVKAGAALFSTGLLITYFFVLGWPRGTDRAAR